MRKIFLLLFICMIPLVTALEMPPQNIEDNMIIYYNLDETSGSGINLVDGRNNASNTAVVQGSSGLIFNAYNYTGSNSYSDFGVVNDLNGVSGFAGGVWFYKSPNQVRTDNNDTIYSCSDSTSNTYSQLILEYNNEPVVAFYGRNSTTTKIVTYPYEYNNSLWQHVLGNFNGTDLELYINGSLVNYTDMSSTLVNSQSWRIGRRRFNINNEYNGTLDELVFWNKSLTSSAITYLYNSGSGRNYTELINKPVENSQTYNSTTNEGNTENFNINITYNQIDYTNSEGVLVYNNTRYTGSKTVDGNNVIFSKSLLVPDVTTETNISFYWEINIINDTNNYYNSSSNNQTINDLDNIMGYCGGSFDVPIINFTLKDEETGSNINPTTNSTTFKVTFLYSIDDSSTILNYSFQELNNNTDFKYDFCSNNANLTFITDLDLLYSAIDYSERAYTLRDANLTNSTSLVNLYLLQDDDSTKFEIDVKQGVSIFPDAVVTISKYFTGEGVYKTTSIRVTDDDGVFTAYLDLDKDYRFQIVKDGILYATIEKSAVCGSAPCELSLNVDEDQGDVWEGYYDYYASNVVSVMNYSSSDKIVRYSFLDTTGLAQYFRLVVYRSKYNETREIVCDNYLYATSGTITCNMTDYNGDFIAKGMIARSPELTDKTLSFIIGELVESLGLMAIFISLAIIITLTFAGAVISRGNPVSVLVVFGLGILALKMMTILPFSWVVVALIELAIIVIIGEVKT